VKIDYYDDWQQKEFEEAMRYLDTHQLTKAQLQELLHWMEAKEMKVEAETDLANVHDDNNLNPEIREFLARENLKNSARFEVTQFDRSTYPHQHPLAPYKCMPIPVDYKRIARVLRCGNRITFKANTSGLKENC
jgi:hypothetical protein